jgi:cell division protein FtsW (lipid II flippase)
VVVLATLGLVLIGVRAIDLARPDGAGGLAADASKQLVFALIGVFAGAMAALVHPRWLAVLAWPAMIGVVGLLVLLLLPFVPTSIVSPRNGARCWINLGFTDIQPSELCKVAYVMVLAVYLRHRSNYRTLKGLIPPSLIAAGPMVLILMQPDLGTAMLFIPTLVAMLVAAGARLGHLIGACALGGAFVVGVVIASLWLARSERYPLLKKYQVERIESVLDLQRGDTRRASDRGFQGQSAVWVAGAGGFAGHPAEKSRALVHFSGLPERHNDMIFAVIVNRHGFLGAAGVIGFYVAWIGGALWTAGACKDPFGRLVVVGCAGMVATQMTINIGMNVGLLPITGITLPFVSYGGSSLLSGMLMVGMIFGVGMRRPEYLWRKSFEYDEPSDE